MWNTLITTIDPVTLFTMLGLGGVVSIVTQFIKHWLSLQNERGIIILTVIISILTVAISYFLFEANQNPHILGPHTAIVGFFATLFYYFITKPFYTVLQQSKAYKASQTAQKISADAVDAINAEDVVIPAAQKIIAEAPAYASTTVTTVKTKAAQVESDIIPTEFAG